MSQFESHREKLEKALKERERPGTLEHQRWKQLMDEEWEEVEKEIQELNQRNVVGGLVMDFPKAYAVGRAEGRFKEWVLSDTYDQ